MKEIEKSCKNCEYEDCNKHCKLCPIFKNGICQCLANAVSSMETDICNYYAEACDFKWCNFPECSHVCGWDGEHNE